MEKILLLTCSVFLIFAQVSSAQKPDDKQKDGSGLYLGASLKGTSWNMPDINVASESGAGYGFKLGYNFNTNFALFASIEGASIDPDQGENYNLGHFDLGAEARIGDYSATVRPFLRASYLGMSAQTNNIAGDIEINGSGLGLGAGIYIFATQNFAVELSYTRSWVNLSEVKVGSSTANIDENANTGRFALGLSYHF